MPGLPQWSGHWTGLPPLTHLIILVSSQPVLPFWHVAEVATVGSSQRLEISHSGGFSRPLEFSEIGLSGGLTLEFSDFDVPVICSAYLHQYSMLAGYSYRAHAIAFLSLSAPLIYQKKKSVWALALFDEVPHWVPIVVFVLSTIICHKVCLSCPVNNKAVFVKVYTFFITVTTVATLKK